MAEAREALVQAWLREAWEALADAEHAAAGDRCNNAAGRLYFACFYAVTALLVQRGERFSKHGGVRALFNQHVGRGGLVAADLVALYNDAFQARLLADDKVDFLVEPARVAAWIGGVRRFVPAIKRLVATASDPGK